MYMLESKNKYFKENVYDNARSKSKLHTVPTWNPKKSKDVG
jgi:fibrillarin-like rRNA methylase